MPKGEAEARKTHCPMGHAYDAPNTRISGVSRYCRKCESDRGKAKRRAGGKVIVLRADRTHCHPYDEANTRLSGGHRYCRTCDKDKQIAKAIANPEKVMWATARQRARRNGVPFEIEPSDIIIPPRCPVLGIELRRNTGTRGFWDASPSLDRIVPSKGYVRGNIAVISYRANRIKNDASLDELESVAAWHDPSRRKGLTACTGP